MPQAVGHCGPECAEKHDGRMFFRHNFLPDTPTLRPYMKVPAMNTTVSDSRTALKEYVQLRTLQPVGPNVHFASLHQSSGCQPP